MTEQESVMKPTKFGETKQIELPSIDVTKHEGKRVIVEKVEEMMGKYGECVMVSSLPLEVIGEGENKTEIRASRVFGLQKDADGQLGWGSETELGKFLKKYKTAHYKDLIGCECLVVLNAKGDKQFLKLV